MSESSISPSVLFKSPNFQLVKCSPNSEYLSYLNTRQEAQTLTVSVLSDPNDIICKIPCANLVNYWWVHNNRDILTFHQSASDGLVLKQWHLKENKATILISGALIKWVQPLKNNPAKMIVCLRLKQSSFYELYSIDVEQGQLEPYYQDNALWEYIVSPHGEVRFGIALTKQGGDIIHLATNETIATLNHHDILLLHRYVGLRPRMSENCLYYVSSQASIAATLCQYEFHSQQTSVLDDSNTDDILEIVYDERTSKPLVAYGKRHRTKWSNINEPYYNHIKQITQYHSSDFRVSAISDNLNTWIIEHQTDTAPCYYSVYQLQNQSSVPLFKETFPCHLNQTECINIVARDDTILPSYLVRSDQSIIAPLIIMIHGGPHSREEWAFEPTRHFLSHRGYHVLSLNYRGSMGFGRLFTEKSFGEWAGAIIDDIKDAADQIIQMGIVDNQKVALLGNSFGGYAALMSAIKYPTTYASVVDMVGPVDFVALADQLPADLKTTNNPLNKMIGCNVLAPDSKKYLQAMSPIHYSEQITVPVLICQGMLDPIVHPTQSIMMREALESHNKEVASVFFDDEGHHLTKLANKISWHSHLEAFMDKCLHKQTDDKAFASTELNI